MKYKQRMAYPHGGPPVPIIRKFKPHRYMPGLLYLNMRRLFFLICFFSFIHSVGQPLRFWHINNSDGLSGSSVKCIFQDKQGFIWIGTDFGLNRYDSKNITVYKSNPVDLNSLPGNKIKKIISDESGLLWIVTDEGLCTFDAGKSEFERLKLYHKEKVIRNINDILVDSKKNIFLATDEFGWGKISLQYKKYDRENFNPLNGDTSVLNKVYAVQSFCEDQQGKFIIGSRAYSIVVNRNNKYELLFKSSLIYPFPAHTVNTIFCDSKNRIWIGAWDNMLHTIDENNKLTSILLPDEKKIDYSGNEIMCINEDADGWLWLGTRRGGLYLYHSDTKKWRHFVQNRFDKNAISNNSVRCIYKDKEGRMWVGTDSGVDIYDPLLNQFEIIYIGGDLSSTEAVNDFLENENKLLIATNEGIYIKYRNSADAKKTFRYKNENLSITNLFRDSYGTIYMGTNKTVFIVDSDMQKLNTLRSFYNRPANKAFDFYDIASSRIVSMAQSRWRNHDVLWISPYGHGLAAYNIGNGAGVVTPVFGKELRYEHLINKIYIDSKQNIFCLTARNGISRNFKTFDFADSIFNLPSTNVKNIVTDYIPVRTEYLDEIIPGFPQDVFDMLETGQEEYWLTSSSSGLYKLNLNKNTLTHFANQFPNMYGMAEDSKNNLWIISSAGIEFFDSKENKFYHFGFSDGIPAEGLQRYFYRTKDNHLLAGGKGYYLKFQPDKIKFNSVKPITAITHFRIFDRNSDSLLLNNRVDLSYRQNHFSFDFASLNYTNPAENKFQYMLDGFDEKWIDAGTRNYVSYTNLNGGNYVFNVRASNNNYIWGDPVKLSINIRPPIWQYKWFYPALFILVSGLLFLIYRNRVRNIHRIQTEKLLAEIDAQEKERRRIARDLHDEFGTKMSALKIYLSTYEKFVDTKNQEAVSTRQELYSIVDDSMYDLRSLLMDLSPKTLEMHGFAQALTDLTGRLSNTHLFNIKTYVDPNLNRFDAKYELTIFRITQELINNSIKHSGCKEISIQLFYRDRTIVYSYEDDGKGFDPGISGSRGYGLKNIETRVSILEGKITWESSAGNGINITIEIPYILNGIANNLK